MTPRDSVDTAIDVAAARITGAKPSDALRANVMSRIASEPPSRFPWRLVLAGGAIASVALITFVSWSANRAISNPTISNPTLNNPTVINSRVATPNPTAVPSRPSPVMSVVTNNTARVERAASFTPSEADLEWSANAPPALERPEPMERVKSLEMKPIDTITPLGVAPLIVVPALGEDGSTR